MLISVKMSTYSYLTNNPKKLNEIKDIEIVERVEIKIEPNQYNQNYLETKKNKMGHLI